MIEKVKTMAKYFILMASIFNTRCILDTCGRQKANFLENLRVLAKIKYVGVSCYIFEKRFQSYCQTGFDMQIGLACTIICM